MEAAGYGQPYKPVPPPKPLPAEGCYSPPPPYRMPPYPLYGETVAIPGSAPEAAMPTPSALHTHSSKFPVSHVYYLPLSILGFLPFFNLNAGNFNASKGFVFQEKNEINI